MIRYLAAGQKPVIVGDHISYKALRGLIDPHIGRLLIPAEDVPKWDINPHAYVPSPVQFLAHRSFLACKRIFFPALSRFMEIRRLYSCMRGIGTTRKTRMRAYSEGLSLSV